MAGAVLWHNVAVPNLPKVLGRPTLAILPRVVDQLGFLYVESARIERDDNGVAAVTWTEGRVESDVAPSGATRTYLPTASLLSVLMGPGSTITQAAMTQVMRDGCVIGVAGAGGARCYGAMTHSDLTTRWLYKQAAAWADETTRTKVAKWMYARRFDTPTLAEDKTIAQLRGMEGQRVKDAYSKHARDVGAVFKRTLSVSDYNSLDPVNKALNAANQVLYGIVHSAVLALGASAGIGFVHTGSQRSFVYDIADLYKLDLSVPLAFQYTDEPNPDRLIRRHFRDRMRALRMLRMVVNDIRGCLTLGAEWDPDIADEDYVNDYGDLGVTYLWDPDKTTVPAKTNYAPGGYGPR